MARLEGFRVRNFKVLKDVTLGCLWNGAKQEALTPITAVIGKNGVGKSVLFDAFAFLVDALTSGVEAACDARGRGGFERIRSQGATGPIAFEVCYKEHGNARPITYQLAIEGDRAVRRFSLRRTNPTLSMHWIRERFGFWKKAKMGFLQSDGQAKTRV